MVASVAGAGGVPAVCPNAIAALSTSRDAVVMVWFNRSLFIPGGMHQRGARSTATQRLNVLSRELAEGFTAKMELYCHFQNRHRTMTAAIRTVNLGSASATEPPGPLPL